MKQHRVAILGGAGFIGRYVVKRLAERGDVLVVGGRNAAAAKFLKLKGDVGQVGLVNLSLADERLLPAFVANSDAVVNLVGILAESGSQRFETLHHVGPARRRCAMRSRPRRSCGRRSCSARRTSSSTASPQWRWSRRSCR